MHWAVMIPMQGNACMFEVCVCESPEKAAAVVAAILNSGENAPPVIQIERRML